LLTLTGDGQLRLQEKSKLSFVDDPRKLYGQRIRATQAKEIVDPKAEAEGSLESPKETPPPGPKRDQHQPPPMGEQPQPKHKIGELCTPDIVDLPIINL
jgi:hypothetical protein